MRGQRMVETNVIRFCRYIALMALFLVSMAGCAGERTIRHTSSAVQYLYGHQEQAEAPASTVLSFPLRVGIAFAPDGKTAATACDDGLIRIYNTADGALLRTLQGHTEAVLALDFTPDGSRLATAASDLTLRLWDPVSGHSLLRLPLPARANRIRFSPDGARLAAALSDGQILILDATTR